MVWIMLLTLFLGTLERVGVPRILTIPYVIASISGFKEFNIRYAAAVFVSGIVFDIIWQTRLGVGSFLFIVSFAVLEMLKIKLGSQVIWVSGLVSVLVSVSYFLINDWPIVWWQVAIIYGVTLFVSSLIGRERGTRGEVFLKRS